MTINDSDTPLSNIIIANTSLPAFITIDSLLTIINIQPTLATAINQYTFDLTISDGFSQIKVPFEVNVTPSI